MTFHHELDQVFALVRILGQELLGSSEDADRIGLHLDLGHSLDIHRHTLARVEILLGRDVEAHQFKRQLAAGLDHRPDHTAGALDHLGAAEPVDDERLVRPDLAIKTCGQRKDQ